MEADILQSLPQEEQTVLLPVAFSNLAYFYFRRFVTVVTVVTVVTGVIVVTVALPSPTSASAGASLRRRCATCNELRHLSVGCRPAPLAFAHPILPTSPSRSPPPRLAPWTRPRATYVPRTWLRGRGRGNVAPWTLSCRTIGLSTIASPSPYRSLLLAPHASPSAARIAIASSPSPPSFATFDIRSAVRPSQQAYGAADFATLLRASAVLCSLRRHSDSLHLCRTALLSLQRAAAEEEASGAPPAITYHAHLAVVRATAIDSFPPRARAHRRRARAPGAS